MIALRKIVLNKSGLSLASLQVACSESMEAKKNGKNLAEFLYYDCAMQDSSKQKRSFLGFITSRVQ